MNIKSLILNIVGLTLLVLLLLTSCNTPQPALTSIPPTAMPAQPTAQARVLPPTATVMLVPPTAAVTLVPPTAPPPGNPSPRGYTSMAYDTESDQVILFGGSTGNYLKASSLNGETWAYNASANKWTEMKPSSGPSKRAAPELVYDTESDRVIMFGGTVGVVTSLWGSPDTWAYDFNTNTWEEMAAEGPKGYIGTRLAYDAESDRIILFGGYDMEGGYLNNTWAYDYNSDTWTEMKPKTIPTGRNYHAMTYDAKNDRVLVWGDNSDGPDDKSMWSYNFNKNTWQEMKLGESAYPAGRDYPVMAYDAESDRTILYGGVIFDGDEIGDETWVYDSNTWTKMKPSNVPGKLSRHAIVYDNAADRIIIFGGWIDHDETNFSNQTWSYDFNTDTWTNLTPKP
jgi:hypothetical protein